MALLMNKSGGVQIAASATIANMRPLTISAWAFPTQIGGGEGQNNGYIYYKQGSGAVGISGGAFFMNAGPVSTTDMVFAHDCTGVNLKRETTAGTISLNKWNHVAVTWDSGLTATNVHIYIGGTEGAAYQTTQNGTLALGDDTNDVLGFGSDVGDNPNFARTVTGNICEIAVWNTQLLPSEIKALAQSRVKGLPLQIQPSFLKMYFPLDDLAEGVPSTTGVTQVFDHGPNRLVGTLTNGTTGASPKGVAEQVLSYQP